MVASKEADTLVVLLTAAVHRGVVAMEFSVPTQPKLPPPELVRVVALLASEEDEVAVEW